jgi:trk system potassium uptake protein
LAKTLPQDRVAVIGLGRFGSALAHELVKHGTQVLAIDSDPRLVQAHSETITHAAIADSTDPVALTQLGLADFPCAVVGIGTDIEASILTTSVLSDLGVPQIWAKAVTPQQQRILERVGAHHVVLPEHDMGERVAHLVTGRLLDFIEFEDDYAIVKTRTPAEAVGLTLGDSRLRSKYNVTVVGIKRPGEGFTYATADTLVQPGDVLIVAGKTQDLERLAEVI